MTFYFDTLKRHRKDLDVDDNVDDGDVGDDVLMMMRMRMFW